MASKNLKDQRRTDLIIPYTPPTAKPDDADIAGTLSTALPMAAMFTRQRMIGWTAVIFAVQNWLNENPMQTAGANKQPAIFSVGMSFMSLFITYMPMFLPPAGGRGASATGPVKPVVPGQAA